jgi:hypothetical protein
MPRCDALTWTKTVKRGAALQLVIGTLLGVFLLSSRAQTPSAITIRIRPTQKFYVPGKPIQIRVELTNSGLRDLLVGRELSGVGKNPADVVFQVRNSSGTSLPTLSAASDCVLTASPDSLPTAVLKRWIALPPGTSYLSDVDLPVSQEVYMGPGRYRVAATYISGGIEEQYWQDCLKFSPEDIAKLPFPAWQGKAKSNFIWIEIRKPGTG